MGRFRTRPPACPEGSTTPRGSRNGLWPRAFARVEPNEDVVVTAVSSNTLEVGPPSAEERDSISRPSIAASQKRIAASWSPTAVALRAARTAGWIHAHCGPPTIHRGCAPDPHYPTGLYAGTSPNVTQLWPEVAHNGSKMAIAPSCWPFQR